MKIIFILNLISIIMFQSKSLIISIQKRRRISKEGRLSHKKFRLNKKKLSIHH